MQGWFFEEGGKSRLLVATGNRGKLVEIAAMLKPFVDDIRSMEDFALSDVEETGATYAENALIKARAAFERSGWASLADDSGFEVEALDDRPGLRSARWAEREDGERDFARAITRVQTEMRSRGCVSSSARFVCALAMVRGDGAECAVEGEVVGEVVFPPRGDGGFGYDPIFRATGGERTFAEMAREEKERVSHRRRAFEALRKACFGQSFAGNKS